MGFREKMREIQPYSKNKSVGLPEDSTMTSKEYKEAMKIQSRKNKYNASKSNYNGYNYDSKLEAAYAQELDMMLKLGEIESWERQVKLPLKINGKTWRNYKIDFKINHHKGAPDYVEVKGFPTPEWKMKWDVLLLIRDEILEPNAGIILQTKDKSKYC